MAPARGATTFRMMHMMRCSGAPRGCQALALWGRVGWRRRSRYAHGGVRCQALAPWGGVGWQTLAQQPAMQNPTHTGNVVASLAGAIGEEGWSHPIEIIS